MSVAGYLFLDAASPIQRSLLKEARTTQLREALKHIDVNRETEYTLYIDEAPKGGTGERAELAEIVRKAEAGAIKTVLFGSLSEIDRDFVKSLDLMRKLALQKVRIICVENHIDTDSFTAR